MEYFVYSEWKQLFGFNISSDSGRMVWLLSSPLPMPLNYFSVHCWFVTLNSQKKFDRWEVWRTPSCCKTSWKYVHKNLFDPWRGISRFPSIFQSDETWPTNLEGIIRGEYAAEIIDFLENRIQLYPCQDKYVFWPGPNSNSFIQWILDKFPHSGIQLPFSARGKHFFHLSK